jgi:2-amino-4-hydroxy-6-hydroxymethyldihydropteridine diphosphokinase
MEIKNTAFLALGSNTGNREKNISEAISLINQNIGLVKKIASNLENEAVGFRAETLFLNTCIEITTHLSPTELLNQLKAIEKTLGRKEKKSDQYESRPIDLDIILYADLVISTDRLIIPHPHFRKRDFVLIPLSEIAPKSIDPITNLCIDQLLELLNSDFKQI